MAATFYALTRSLAATIIFNNVRAITGFVRNGLSITGSNLLGFTIAVIAIATVSVIVAALGSPRKAAWLGFEG